MPGEARREVWSQDVIAVMTVMTVNFGKPIKTYNYLERCGYIFAFIPHHNHVNYGVATTGTVDWYWFLDVLSQVKLSASHSRIWRRLWKYSRLVLAGMHHQSKLDPRKTSASLCWMGREFLANVKNIWKDLANINSVGRTGVGGGELARCCVFSIFTLCCR